MGKGGILLAREFPSAGRNFEYEKFSGAIAFAHMWGTKLKNFPLNLFIYRRLRLEMAFSMGW